ncbi:MAG: adenosylcobinamide amidohydrolase [Chloroflexi bacterium]|nr:adenosylcobinamide amidohydrolase [Chloroflexota bacterium]
MGTNPTNPGIFEDLAFPMAALRRDAESYALRLDKPFQFLSSASVGEGFLDSRWVLSRQVGRDARLPDPKAYLQEDATLVGVPNGEPYIGLLTAVSHLDLQVVSLAEDGVAVTVITTAGVDPGSSPLQKQVSFFGDPVDGLPDAANRPGTINTVVLVDAALTPGALVRASTMATEAKTLALVESGLKTSEDHLVTGTPTDTTVVGHSGQGKEFKYSGSATLVGWLVAKASYISVRDGLAAFAQRDY